MFEFFSSIGDIISTIVDFVVSLVDGIFSLFAAIGNGLAFVRDCIALLPPWLSAGCLVMVAACVVRFLIKGGAPDA